MKKPIPRTSGRFRERASSPSRRRTKSPVRRSNRKTRPSKTQQAGTIKTRISLKLDCFNPDAPGTSLYEGWHLSISARRGSHRPILRAPRALVERGRCSNQLLIALNFAKTMDACGKQGSFYRKDKRVFPFTHAANAIGRIQSEKFPFPLDEGGWGGSNLPDDIRAAVRFSSARNPPLKSEDYGGAN